MFTSSSLIQNGVYYEIALYRVLILERKSFLSSVIVHSHSHLIHCYVSQSFYCNTGFVFCVLPKFIVNLLYIFVYYRYKVDDESDRNLVITMQYAWHQLNYESQRMLLEERLFLINRNWGTSRLMKFWWYFYWKRFTRLFSRFICKVLPYDVMGNIFYAEKYG